MQAPRSRWLHVRWTDLEMLAREIGAEGGAAQAFELDVGDTASINACVSAVQNVYGRLDILVNNAGLGANHPAVDVTEADWDDMMSVNLKGSSFAVRRRAASCFNRDTDGSST